MSTLLALLLIPAASAEPDRVAASWTIASPADAVIADSGDTVAILGTGFTLLDLATWSTTAVSVCSSGGDPVGLAAGTGTASDGTTSDSFWVGCGDGTIERIDVTDGSPSRSSDVIEATTTAITSLEYDGTWLYVLSTGTSGLADVTAISPDDLTTASGYPTTLSYDTVNDSLLLNGSIYVLNGNDHVSRITTSGGGVILSTQTTGANYLTATPSDAGMVYLTDSNGGDIWSFDTGSNGFSLLVSDAGDATTALCLDETAGWAAISADTDLAFYDFTSGSFGSESSRIASVGALDRLLAVNDGALGLSTDDSVVDWVTAAPWVEITSAPSTAGTDPVDLSFTSDVGGDWTLSLGDTLTDAVAIDTGTISAGETATVSTTVDSTWIEGRNRLWVTVDDGVNIGHDATDVTVDTPPPQPSITIGFGESSINVQIAADDTEDLDHYDVYLSDVAFTADEYATGGPAFDDGNVEAPVTLTATPGVSTSYTFYPLENGTLYYAAVRAVDAGGQEGPMSQVLSATPTYTYSASELRGDEGGFGCSTSGAGRPGNTVPISLLVSGAVALRARRGRGAGRAG